MPLRILLDARHVRDFGFGTYIRNLVRGLVAIGAPHHFLLVAHKADQHEFDGLPANFELLFYERKDADPLDQVAFPWFVRSQQVDLAHIPLNTVPLTMPRPYVVTVHDLSSLVWDAPSGWKHELRQLQVRRGLLRAECVMAVSESTRHDVIQLLGIPAERVRRIYGGADPRFTHHIPGPGARAAGPEAWAHERRRILERYGIHYPFLLYAGTIRAQKNIPRLVEAFSLLRGELQDMPQWRDLRLIIIGDEISRYPAVRQAVIQSRIEQQVRFLGFVPLDTLRVFYEAASAFVFPSLYEGFGLPPLEAMASGTPVVCSNATSLPEVVGDAAMIVSPDNVFDIARGMKEVLLDAALRAELVRRGAERSRFFRWEDTAREVLDTYVTAATGRGRT
ncbi:glycosyltransferase family 4 protein [Paludibaculum fermentans]|uniref:glycosyltransferase family 4 protein n=1 Tax=Paludibaculum fermentans TaxID=1473598 RepID=UPI003EBFAC65